MPLRLHSRKTYLLWKGGMWCVLGCRLSRSGRLGRTWRSGGIDWLRWKAKGTLTQPLPLMMPPCPIMNVRWWQRQCWRWRKRWRGRERCLEVPQQAEQVEQERMERVSG